MCQCWTWSGSSKIYGCYLQNYIKERGMRGGDDNSTLIENKNNHQSLTIRLESEKFPRKVSFLVKKPIDWNVADFSKFSIFFKLIPIQVNFTFSKMFKKVEFSKKAQLSAWALRSQRNHDTNLMSNLRRWTKEMNLKRCNTMTPLVQIYFKRNLYLNYSSAKHTMFPFFKLKSTFFSTFNK